MQNRLKSAWPVAGEGPPDLLLYPYPGLEDEGASADVLHGVVLAPPRAVFGPRELKQWTIFWLVVTPADSKLILDGESYAARSGAFFLLRPGMRDELRLGNQGSTVLAYSHFRLALPDAGWPAPASWPVVRYEEKGSVLPSLFRYLLQIQGLPGVPGQPLLRSVLQLFLNAFLTGQTAMIRQPRPVFPELVDEALQFANAWVRERPSERLSVAELARSVHVSPDHLTRLFQRSIGVGPAEYLMLARVDHAADVLRDTGETVERIAERCGFHDQAHFSRSFKRVMGRTPSEFRRLTSIDRGASRPLFSLHLRYLEAGSDRTTGPEGAQLIGDLIDGEKREQLLEQLEAWNRVPFPAEDPSGVAIDYRPIPLARWYNRSLEPEVGWFGRGELDLARGGETWFHGIPFRVGGEQPDAACAVLLGPDREGKLAGWEEIEWPLEGRGRWIHLLLAAHRIRSRQPVCRWRVQGASRTLAKGEAVGLRKASEPNPTWAVTSWWQGQFPVRSSGSLPVLIPSERARQSAVFYILRIPLPGKGRRKFRLAQGESPVLLLAATEAW